MTTRYLQVPPQDRSLPDATPPNTYIPIPTETSPYYEEGHRDITQAVNNGSESAYPCPPLSNTTTTAVVNYGNEIPQTHIRLSLPPPIEQCVSPIPTPRVDARPHSHSQAHSHLLLLPQLEHEDEEHEDEEYEDEEYEDEEYEDEEYEDQDPDEWEWELESEDGDEDTISDGGWYTATDTEMEMNRKQRCRGCVRLSERAYTTCSGKCVSSILMWV
ncbi:hypothetical protein BJX76DRAFT_356125 [Aspergillus varians]